jgi:hypothetical protein
MVREHGLVFRYGGMTALIYHGRIRLTTVRSQELLNMVNLETSEGMWGGGMLRSLVGKAEFS